MSRIAALVCLLTAIVSAQETPKALFTALKEAGPRGEDSLKSLFSDSVTKHMRPYQFNDLAKLLGDAKRGNVKKVGDQAVVHFKVGKEEWALLVKRHGTRWQVAGPCAYLISGASLDARRGKKPARVLLTTRTENGQYGTSACSFTYVTQDASKCKNRMNIWFCHNGDLHSVRGRILALGKSSLKRVKTVPASEDWDRTARAEMGHVYVVHCQRPGRSDYFVKLTVRKIARDGVQIEWTLLSDGLGAPASIHEPQPPDDSREGAEGYDGLCGKNG